MRSKAARFIALSGIIGNVTLPTRGLPATRGWISPSASGPLMLAGNSGTSSESQASRKIEYCLRSFGEKRKPARRGSDGRTGEVSNRQRSDRGGAGGDWCRETDVVRL